MSHGQRIMEMGARLQAKGSKVVYGDICADDYGPGLQNAVGGFIVSVHDRTYEVAAGNAFRSIRAVSLRNGAGGLQALSSSSYQLITVNNTVYVKINDSVALSGYLSIVIDYLP